ncbi:hypothetical protein GCM10010971_37840 [Silvimonas amylolytica]|uniref:Uncharacterized protein n=1 Tax=Silvimonas amylolytica TaxID=449663 RepID=A0ABQ2PQQ8_9NEIS|nr:hypothetical protein GCM10010971_37840 [Silvimonas amylolytica]
MRAYATGNKQPAVRDMHWHMDIQAKLRIHGLKVGIVPFCKVFVILSVITAGVNMLTRHCPHVGQSEWQQTISRWRPGR